MWSSSTFFCPKVTLNHGRPVPAVLLANKSDQLVSQQPKLDVFCRENGFVGWFETSAKVWERRPTWLLMQSLQQAVDFLRQIVEYTKDFCANRLRLRGLSLTTQMITLCHTSKAQNRVIFAYLGGNWSSVISTEASCKNKRFKKCFIQSQTSLFAVLLGGKQRNSSTLVWTRLFFFFSFNAFPMSYTQECEVKAAM